MKKLFTITTLMIMIASFPLTSAAMVKVKALGSFPRGQFVACEEYGHKNSNGHSFSKIRIMNVWKNSYVEDPIQIIGKKGDKELGLVRMKAKKIASKRLKKFNISNLN